MAQYRTPAVREQEDFLFHLYRAIDLLKQNQTIEAKEEIELALVHAPTDARSQDLLARTYYRMGMYPLAVEIFENLLKRYPKELNLRLNLSLSFLRSKQPALALPHLHHFLTHHPKHERALCLLGLAYWNLGRPEEATHLFEQAGRKEWMAQLSPHPPQSLPHATLAGGSETVLARLDIRSEPPTIREKSYPPSLSDDRDMPSRSGIRSIVAQATPQHSLEQWKVDPDQIQDITIDDDGQL
ncbi:MAG: tetratricopeptide repeat protein [Myxococcales bacterium]|nr:MAG: tetratricopeptide repeat protein [Myxococcales bacterium]